MLGSRQKSAATDCIKRCAHPLVVGLHLYSKDGYYRSFRLKPAQAETSSRKLLTVTRDHPIVRPPGLRG